MSSVIEPRNYPLLFTVFVGPDKFQFTALADFQEEQEQMDPFLVWRDPEGNISHRIKRSSVSGVFCVDTGDYSRIPKEKL